MVKIAELNRKLQYDPSTSESNPRKPSILKDSIQSFIRDHGSKYLVATKWSDKSVAEIKQSMSWMASDYLLEEGPRLWPSDENSALYSESLNWSQHEETIKDIIADYFFAKSVIKHKNGKRASVKQDAPRKSQGPSINSGLTGRSLRSDSSLQTQDAIHDPTTAGPSTAVSDRSRHTPDSDPFRSDSDGETTLDDARGPGPRDVGEQQRQAGSLPIGSVDSDQSATALGPTDTIHNKSRRVGSKATTNSPGNRRAGDENLLPISTADGLVELSPDDDDFDLDLLSPRRTQTNNAKGKGKANEMPPPPPRSERSLPTPAARSTQDVPSPINELPEIAYRFRGPSAAATLSPVTLGRRSPSAIPRAPDALMMDREQEEVHLSIETAEGQEISGTTSGNTDIVASKPLSKAHIWYHAVESRYPEEKTSCWGPDRVKTLAQLKRKLPMDFDQGRILGLKVTLKGPSVTRDFEIDHNDDHQLKRIQDMQDKIISQTMEKSGKSSAGTPVTFDIEVELVRGERQAS